MASSPCILSFAYCLVFMLMRSLHFWREIDLLKKSLISFTPISLLADKLLFTLRLLNFFTSLIHLFLNINSVLIEIFFNSSSLGILINIFLISKSKNLILCLQTNQIMIFLFSILLHTLFELFVSLLERFFL